MKIRNLTVLVSILCLLSLVGCQNVSNHIKNEEDKFFSVRNLNRNEYDEIYTYIITNEPDWMSKEALSINHEPFYWSVLASQKICSVGIKGIPVLIDVMNDENVENIFRISLSQGMYTILRVNQMEPNPNTYCKESIIEFYKRAKSQVPLVIKSQEDFEIKLAKLVKYGIYAVPFIVEEIEKGDIEYQEFFTSIGLHLNHETFAKMAAFSYVYCDDMHLKEDFLQGSDDFDYKVWLSENEEDLNNLFKFLDAYCAEYEAEQNSK